MYQKNSWGGRKPLPVQFEIDGAREAASAISAFLKERMSPAAGASETFPATHLQEPVTEHKP
jgi:hypothetical protein